MSAREALFARLTADPSIAGIVTDRVYPARLPQAPTLPAITYDRISAPRDQMQDGALVNPRYRLVCWADDYDSADDLGDAVIQALTGWRTVSVLGAVIDDDSIEVEADTGLFRRDVEVLLWTT